MGTEAHDDRLQRLRGDDRVYRTLGDTPVGRFYAALVPRGHRDRHGKRWSREAAYVYLEGVRGVTVSIPPARFKTVTVADIAGPYRARLAAKHAIARKPAATRRQVQSRPSLGVQAFERAMQAIGIDLVREPTGKTAAVIARRHAFPAESVSATARACECDRSLVRRVIRSGLSCAVGRPVQDGSGGNPSESHPPYEDGTQGGTWGGTEVAEKSVFVPPSDTGKTGVKRAYAGGRARLSSYSLRISSRDTKREGRSGSPPVESDEPAALIVTEMVGQDSTEASPAATCTRPPKGSPSRKESPEPVPRDQDAPPVAGTGEVAEYAAFLTRALAAIDSAATHDRLDHYAMKVEGYAGRVRRDDLGRLRSAIEARRSTLDGGLSSLGTSILGQIRAARSASDLDRLGERIRATCVHTKPAERATLRAAIGQRRDEITGSATGSAIA